MACNSNDYQFTKVPTKLYLCLDNNCRSMLFTLIQLSTMFGDEQGWFFRSNADMEAETGLSKKVMDGTLDALLQKGLIDFIPQQQGQGVKQSSRKYLVNYDSFLEYEKLTLDDCIKNPEYKVLTSDYKNGAFTWKGKEWAGKQASLSLKDRPASTPTSTPTSPQPQPEVPTSIDTIDNKDNINKKLNKLLNINYLNNNITSVESNSAEHSTRSGETMDSPSSSHELGDESETYHPSSRNPSDPYDDCLIYVKTHKAPQRDEDGGYSLKVYYDYCLAQALIKMVNRDVKHLPNDESTFFEAVKKYMELYEVSRERAIKDINILKSKARKIRDEQLKDVA